MIKLTKRKFKSIHVEQRNVDKKKQQFFFHFEEKKLHLHKYLLSSQLQRQESYYRICKRIYIYMYSYMCVSISQVCTVRKNHQSYMHFVSSVCTARAIIIEDK